MATTETSGHNKALLIEALDMRRHHLPRPLGLRLHAPRAALRADGKQVVGFGAAQTPAPFVHSCTRFLYLDDDQKAKAVHRTKAAPATSSKATPN